MDTSLIDVDVEPFYARITIKKKIFQIAYHDEVKPDETLVQRSQATGHLMVTLKKLMVNEVLLSAKKSQMPRWVSDCPD